MAKDKITTKGKPNASKENGESTAKPASGIWQDARFQHLVSDPRFRSLPKVQRKVKIDKRFQGMFTNDKFKVKYTVDKYGRKINKSNAEDLRKYYELNTSDEEEENEEVNAKLKPQEDEEVADEEQPSSSEEEEEEREKEEKALLKESEPGADENDALTSDDEEVPTTLREKLVDPNIDYARGEGRLVTDSSSDDESSEDEEPEMYIDHVWGELDNDAETTDESTKRLAVCNMDWDRVRAVDLMVLFNSFLPRGGAVLSVTIYPSEFGKQRMKEEEEHGPPELVGLGKEGGKTGLAKTGDNDDSSDDSASEDELVQEQDSDAGEGDDYHMEKLRQYQLNRLRYYYAVLECDSVETADKIYRECDGIEYESSATKVDLRFIPDDTTFDEDQPTDVCTEMPDASFYQPRQFTTTALQQAKVDLTWDETAVDRKELGDKLSAGKMEGISDKDLRKIVAYSSEEEEEDAVSNDETQNEEETQSQTESQTQKKGKQKKSKKKDEVINKYKALLAEINEKEQKEKAKKKYEMEFSWDVNDTQENDNNGLEEDVNTKPKAELTPIEKVLQKRNEKNKKRKEERKKKKRQTNGGDDDGTASDLDSLPDGVDMEDPYFAEEFANGDFVDPKAKRKEKQKKKQQIKEEQEQEDEKQAKELELLLEDDEEDKQHFSLEKILKSEQETKSKKKRRKQLKKSKNAIEKTQKPVEDNFELNIGDDRFKAVFTSHEFNIDPTNPHFKKTKAMESLIHEKLKRRHGGDKEGGKQQTAAVGDEQESSEAKKPRKHLETTMLVKSLKRKIQMKQEGR